MNSTPFFSIIMPLYNHEKFVGEAISSALNQNFENFELVICNDGSTDKSEDIVLGFNDKRIKYFKKNNGGAASALNACLLDTKGQYICWLSSDDIFHENKLSEHYLHHLNNEPISIAPYGLIFNNEFLPVDQKKPDPDNLLLEFLLSTYINGLSICVRRDIYRDSGLFNFRYKYACDAEKWFSIFKLYKPYFIGSEALSFSRKNTSSLQNASIKGYIDALRFFTDKLNLSGFSIFIFDSTNLDAVFWEMCTKIICSHENIFAKFGCVDLLWGHFLHFLKSTNQYSIYLKFISEMELDERNIEFSSNEVYKMFKEFLTSNKESNLPKVTSFEILAFIFKENINIPLGSIGPVIQDYLLYDY